MNGEKVKTVCPGLVNEWNAAHRDQAVYRCVKCSNMFG